MQNEWLMLCVCVWWKIVTMKGKKMKSMSLHRHRFVVVKSGQIAFSLSLFLSILRIANISISWVLLLLLVMLFPPEEKHETGQIEQKVTSIGRIERVEREKERIRAHTQLDSLLDSAVNTMQLWVQQVCEGVAHKTGGKERTERREQNKENCTVSVSFCLRVCFVLQACRSFCSTFALGVFLLLQIHLNSEYFDWKVHWIAYQIRVLPANLHAFGAFHPVLGFAAEHALTTNMITW